MVSAGRSVFTTALELLIRGQDLGGARMGELMQAIFRGECTESELGGVLIGLRMKGETAEELAAAAAVMREHCVALKVEQDDVLDTCGTGGDGICTFNISTATALVAAGAGVPVVKHGNRAMSSQSGSADVLAALGVQADPDPAQAQRSLARAGMAFCLAPHYHPSLRHVGVVRRQLGVRTMFNCLGPLANPAQAPYQLLGVGHLEWLDRLAAALAVLGTRHAFLVCGHDGLDEVSLSAPTHVREVRGHEVTAREWAPADFGLAPCRLDELHVSGPAESAAVIRAVLNREQGPARRVVLANAAAALLAAERVGSLREGVERAAEAVDSGRAARVLTELIALSPAGPS